MPIVAPPEIQRLGGSPGTTRLGVPAGQGGIRPVGGMNSAPPRGGGGGLGGRPGGGPPPGRGYNRPGFRGQGPMGQRGVTPGMGVYDDRNTPVVDKASISGGLPQRDWSSIRPVNDTPSGGSLWGGSSIRPVNDTPSGGSWWGGSGLTPLPGQMPLGGDKASYLAGQSQPWMQGGGGFDMYGGGVQQQQQQQSIYDQLQQNPIYNQMQQLGAPQSAPYPYPGTQTGGGFGTAPQPMPTGGLQTSLQQMTQPQPYPNPQFRPLGG